jgi:hypothetical protein
LAETCIVASHLFSPHEVSDADPERRVQDLRGGRPVSQLYMTTEEAELVRDMLRYYLATLTMEIDHADRRDFKKMLVGRRARVASLLERCSTPPVDDRPRHREATGSH